MTSGNDAELSIPRTDTLLACPLGAQRELWATIQGRPSCGSKQEARKNIKARIPKIFSKTPATIRNLVNAVGLLEQWLASHFPTERRALETIPPENLDGYLADFFTNVKKPCGEDYDVVSFSSLRSNINRFLEENGYSYSISNAGSPYFSRSQDAYVLRRKVLSHLSVEKRKRQLAYAEDLAIVKTL